MDRDQVVARDAAALQHALATHLSAGEPYAVLDFPDYSNVGDSLIWLGAVKLLTAIAGRPPSYVSTIADFDEAALRAAVAEGPVFLQGGGNFGDIYPRHQAFREHILERFPDRSVIQLPQSIKFRDPDTIAATARIIGRHERFTLYVRDTASAALARRQFACIVEMLPDCAFGLGPLERRRPTEVDLLFLLRQDDEKVARDLTAFNAFGAAPVVDWLGDPGGFAGAAKRAAAFEALTTGKWSRASRRAVHYTARATARLERGAMLLSQAQRIITDRLHAHIMSLLLDIPHVALDNDYGKIHGYIDAWTAPYKGLRTASTPAEAVAALKTLSAPMASAA